MYFKFLHWTHVKILYWFSWVHTRGTRLWYHPKRSMFERDVRERGRRTTSASVPGGATVSARAIDRIAYLPAAAAEHPPSARLSARRRLQPGKFSPLHGYRLTRRLQERPRGRHRDAAGVRTRPEHASLPREVPAVSPRLRPPSHPLCPLLLTINNSGYAASAYVG